VSTNSNQIQLSASSRGITDYFFCFTCDEYVWDCDHLIDDPIVAPRVPAWEGSALQSFTYDGKSRTLEIEFRVTAPFAYNEVTLPPPPKVIQYFDVPRHIFTKLIRFKSARGQERFWADVISRQYACQTVRTVCRIPRVWRFSEARNIRHCQFDEYVAKFDDEERQSFLMTIAAMRILLLRTLAPKRVAGLGGLLECRCCGRVGPDLTGIRHRNCRGPNFVLADRVTLIDSIPTTRMMSNSHPTFVLTPSPDISSRTIRAAFGQSSPTEKHPRADAAPVPLLRSAMRKT